MVKVSKIYTDVKKALFSKLSWFNAVSLVKKAEIYELYGAEKSIPREIFLMDAKEIVKTIAVSTKVVRHLTKVFESTLEDIPVEWYQAEKADSATTEIRKRIIKVRKEVESKELGKKSAEEAMKLAETIPALKNNKAFIKMQKNVLNDYAFSEQDLAKLKKQLTEMSGTETTADKILSPNGLIMAMLAYTAYYEEVETSEEILLHAKNAKNWKDNIGDCFKRWLVEHPEQAYESLAEHSINFTAEQLVTKIALVKAKLA